jgi:hypothetical protein
MTEQIGRVYISKFLYSAIIMVSLTTAEVSIIRVFRLLVRLFHSIKMDNSDYTVLTWLVVKLNVCLMYQNASELLFLNINV